MVIFFLVLLPYEITLFSNVSRLSTLSDLVLLPYEITLFSNDNTDEDIKIEVLLPYEITLFSNVDFTVKLGVPVLLPYEITLFSNGAYELHEIDLFYYLMKLHYSQTSNKLCHYNAQGNSQDIVYIIVLIIITVNNTQIRVQNMYLFKF